MMRLLLALYMLPALAHAQYTGSYLPKSGGTITGALGVNGNITSGGTIGTAISGGNNLTMIGGPNGSVPTLSATGSNLNVTLKLMTQGAGPVQVVNQLQAQGGAAVTGDLTATGNITAAGQGTIPVFGATGTAFGNQHMTVGYQALTGGTATVTFSGAGAFANGTSYVCTATDASAVSAVSAVPVSGTSLTLTGAGATDTVAYQCVGN